MEQNKEVKLFAFKLAKQEEGKQEQTQWQVREGVALAGCSGDDARASSRWGGRDNGIYC